MRQKLQRFKDNEQALNIIEPGKDLYDKVKGKWRKDYFHNNHDITLELGCGSGAYVTSLGERFPENNYIGVDIKGSRIWTGSQYAITHDLNNVGFLRTQIEQLDTFFDAGEINEILVTFPDPRPKLSDEKRRLTSPRFLDLYKTIMVPSGKVTLKTDSKLLYEYSRDLVSTQKLNILTDIQDLHNNAEESIHKEIMTTYEKRFVAEGLPIFLLTFEL